MSRARCVSTGRGNHTYLLEQEGTAVAQRTCAPTSSTSAPAAPIPHDLPALPGSDLAALRASIDSWDNRPILPTLPGQRRSPEQPTPKIPGQRSSVYDDVVLGDQYNDNFANGCF